MVYSRWDFARPADVIIVLGASVDGDGSPGETLESRIEHAVTLWRRGLARRIICTGGYTGQAHRTESSACRATLIALGVPPEAVYIEEQSQNTYENAQYALEIMAENDLQTAVVVSSGYHLLRARWLFWRAGQPVHTSPAGIGFLEHATWFMCIYGRWGVPLANRAGYVRGEPAAGSSSRTVSVGWA